LSAYKNFKTFYLEVAIRYWCRAFPKLVSYNRFVEWKPSMLIPLMAYLSHNQIQEGNEEQTNDNA